ncbi:MAG TPA: methylmalonyl-CoA mutase family protein [Afifellaceae bacterium]|nr:methylmalonyl-CoA mutase family protein [Afifellaceae bacterium]
MSDIQPLAAGFAKRTQSDWEAQAANALKGAPLVSLNSNTADGSAIAPVYPRARGIEPIAGRIAGAPWTIAARVDHPDPKEANRLVRAELAHGASEVALVFQGAPSAYGFGLPADEASLRQALDGIRLDAVPLRIEPHPRALESAAWISALVDEAPFGRVETAISFGIDMAGGLVRHGILPADSPAMEAQVAACLVALRAADQADNQFGFIGNFLEADGRVYHDAGASSGLELGAVFATIASLLRGLAGKEIDALDLMIGIGVSLAVDQNQLESIAKLRACRLLWNRLAEILALPLRPPLRVHAQTSWPMMTRRDPHGNLLRTTLAAFAAGVGGANSIAVLPFTQALGLPDSAARRLARNTQLLLMEESHIDAVMDPSAGSGALEALTDATCQAAWQAFQEIEKAGGIVAALACGMVQDRIAQHRQSVAAAVADGTTAIIGTTDFGIDAAQPADVLVSETLPDGAIDMPATPCVPLLPWRIAENHEASGKAA